MTVDHESQWCFVSAHTSIWTLLLLRLLSLPIYSTCSTVNMKHYASVVSNRGEKHTICLLHLLSPFPFVEQPLIASRLRIPSRLFYFYFYFSFSCFSFRTRLPIWLPRVRALVPSRLSSSQAKSTPWQVVSAPQRLALEIQYGLPTYPQVEQGWDFPEVVLWHINLQIMW